MPRKPSVKIENVVASASLNQRLDLNRILKNAVSNAYKPEKLPGLVYRLERPKSSAIIFGSGKMICAGTRSEKKARNAISRILRDLNEKGVRIYEKPEVKIVNMVASINLRGRVDLEESAESLTRIIYEPEQFPGLIYHMQQPKVVILLFTSGKAVCVGARKEDEVAEAANLLNEALQSKNLISYE